MLLNNNNYVKKRKEELPLNLFLQSEEYEALKYNLGLELNLNTVHVNTEIDKYSNLIVGYTESFKKTPQEKKQAKLTIQRYKLMKDTEKGELERSYIIEAFIKTKMPNWSFGRKPFSVIN